VEPLIDILLPNKLQQKMLFIIKNHLKIFNLEKMSIKKIATFFQEYRKDIELFQAQLIFAKADTNGRISTDKKYLNEKLLLTIFEKIAQYSPTLWISNQKHQPNGNTIKQHIHRVNIEIVSEQSQYYFLT
jgi:hypothetical protein